MVEIHLSVPEGQRYSCQQCGWCCRGWRIQVEPEDRDRVLSHDWPKHNPRLRGVRLFEELRSPGQLHPTILIAQLKGSCVFLEEDNRCLIHRVLGEAAKPFTCRRFPYLLGSVANGVMVGADYACQAMVRSHGRPFTCDEALVQEWLERTFGSGGITQQASFDPEILLSAGLRVSWDAYLRIEGALLCILERRETPVEQRLLAGVELLSAAATWGSGMGWLDRMEIEHWLQRWRDDGFRQAFDLALTPGAAISMPRLSDLAPLIGDAETPHNPASGRGSAAIGYALAVASSSGCLYLSTLGTWVDLSALGLVEQDLDRPQFGDYLTRFLSNHLLRKSLLESANLKQGWTYLCHSFGLVRWYAAASAAVHGRGRVEEDDLVAGMQAVEKGYVP